MKAAFVPLVAFVAAAHSSASAQAVSDMLDAELETLRVQQSLPGLFALVAKGGQIVAQGTAGFRRVGSLPALGIADAVNIGSCTKWMTATLAGRLVDRGVIAWDTRIRDVFPNYPAFHPAYHDVTLEELLAHRGGVPESNVWEPRYRNALQAQAGTLLQLRRWVADVTLAAAPQVARGTELYSNQGYAIVATMLELRTGRSWESLMQTEIFTPLGLASARIGSTWEDDRVPPTGVVGHDFSGGRSVPRAAMNAATFLRYQASNAPAGMVVCTLPDWARFLRTVAIAPTGFLSAATARRLRTPAVTGAEVGYGLGVGIFNRSWAAPDKALNHTGDILGQTSLFWIAPAHDLVVLVCANVAASGSPSAAVRDAVATTLIGRYRDAIPFGPDLDGTSPSAPVITVQPSSRTVASGERVSFAVTAEGRGPLTYQWTFNDNAIAGATSASFTVPAAAPGDVGYYAVLVGNATGISASTAALLSLDGPSPTPRLSNLSVLSALPAGGSLTAGYTLSGGPKPLLLRVVGPGLADVGVARPMQDPAFTLFGGSRLLGANDDWLPAPALDTASRLVGAFPLTSGSRDAVLLRTVDGGGSISVYDAPKSTARSSPGGPVLVEVYDAGQGTTSRLVNLSVLHDVGATGGLLTAGFTIAGAGTRTVLIRAVGPGLAPFGIDSPLPNPRLELYAADQSRLEENEDWNPALASTFSAVGAFALPPGSRDAALRVSLPAGGYTVQVSGGTAAQAAVLLEIYEVN